MISLINDSKLTSEERSNHLFSSSLIDLPSNQVEHGNNEYFQKHNEKEYHLLKKCFFDNL